MINWPAVKEAALPKGYTGGKIHWNHWIGEYRAHPSDNDLERLSKLPQSKYEKMRDIIADNDQWAREDAALRRSMHWKPLNYIPLPIAAVPAVAAADAKAANKLVGDPQYEEARKIMHQTIQLDPKRVLKYRRKIDNLVADLRARTSKINAKRASESSTDLDPDVKWEGLPFGDEVKQRVHEMMRKVWTRRLADAYLKATGKELKSPEKHLDPQVGYMIGHGANVDPKILKKLNPEDSYQMQGTWSSADNITPLMIDDAVKVLQSNPRWNTLEHVGGNVRGMRGPVPSVTWNKP